MLDYDTKIMMLESKRAKLCAERDSLNEDIVKLYKKIEKLREKKEQEEMKAPMTPVEEMEYFLFEDGRVSGERYEAREKYWNDKGLYHSGYYHELEQVNLQLTLYKGEKDNLEQTIKVVEEVLPLLKKDSKGIKHLDIFEHTLSEYGTYSVEISDESFDLILHRYRIKSVVKSFDNLRSLVEYVQEHHYYENSEDNKGD